MTNDDVICMALERELQKDLEFYNSLPRYNISRRFDKKMKKLIKNSMNDGVGKMRQKHIPFSKRLLIAAIVIITMAVLTGGTLYITKQWGSFSVKQFEIYSKMNITDKGDYPKTLEEYYEFTFDKDNYTKEIITDEAFTHGTEYISSDNSIIFTQSAKDKFKGARLNTENALTYPEGFEIDGCTAVYYETFYGCKVLIWDNGEYIFDFISSDFSKNELINMIKYVKKVEK